MTATEFIGTVLAYGFFLMLGLIMLLPLLRWLNKQRKRTWQGIKYQRGRLILRPGCWLKHINQIYALQEQITRLEAQIEFMQNTHVKKERSGQLMFEFIDVPRGHNGAMVPFVDTLGNTFGIRAGDHERIRAGDLPVIDRNTLEQYRRGEIDTFAKRVKWVKEDYKPQKGEVIVPEKYYSGLFVLLEEAQQLQLFQEN